MVVLSGCETGMGRVADEDGVYGLRRAFQLAGAKCIISTLWQIPDKATSKFISALCRDLDMKADITLRNIQIDYIREKRRSGLSDHPRLWGAFIISGAWR